MDVHFRIISSIVILLALICLAMLLKRFKVLDEHQGRLFSKLVTHLTLPALIFVSLANTELLWSEGELALIMIIVTLICLALGWLVARMLRLDGPRKGPVILVAGFGSSSLLGLALISEVFPDDDQAMAEAVILSGLGVQPLLFTVGTVIALYYGSQSTTSERPYQSALRYFRSPIFLAFISGLVVAYFLEGRSHPILESVLDGVYVVGAANTFMVTLAVGLLLHLDGLKQVAMIGAYVGVVKLVIMPVLLWLPTLALTLPNWQIEVLVLEGAMPSAMLAVVLCSTYGCDAKFASKLVFATTLPSIITVPILFELLR